MSPSTKPTLNLMVALHSEAAPLIDFYKLQKSSSPGAQWYGRETSGAQINLIVTGIGRVAMAAAVGWLAAMTAASRLAWLNVGTAGHKAVEIGQVLRIACCEGEPGGRRHFPALVAPWHGAIGSVQTGDHVCRDYPAQALVDMEASAFFTTATRFSPSELVQGLKVVSDNSEADITDLNAAALRAAIADNLAPITGFADAMLTLAECQPETIDLNNEFCDATRHLRMTASQQRQWQEAARHLINAGADSEALKKQLLAASEIKSVLSLWRDQLCTMAPVLS